MLKDFLGQEIKVGDVVLRSVASSSGAYFEKRTVTHIIDDKVHLDNSHVAIQYPKRLVVINNLLNDND